MLFSYLVYDITMFNLLVFIIAAKTYKYCFVKLTQTKYKLFLIVSMYCLNSISCMYGFYDVLEIYDYFLIHKNLNINSYKSSTLFISHTSKLCTVNAF